MTPWTSDLKITSDSSVKPKTKKWNRQHLQNKNEELKSFQRKNVVDVEEDFEKKVPAKKEKGAVLFKKLAKQSKSAE